VSIRVAPCADFEEFAQAVFAIGQYFGMNPADEITERFSRNLPIERMHAAREGAAIVGGAGAFPLELTVPGAVVPTAGTTVVGTFPTHRRRGVLRALMRAQLDDAHERGDPLAALWASEETIYGRFGYGLSSLTGEAAIPRSHSDFAQPLEREGRMRLVEADEALELFPRVWDRIRRRIPGMLGRSRSWWEHRVLSEWPGGGGDGGPKRFVVLEKGGRPQGYAVYRHRPKLEGGIAQSTLDVVEAIALDGRPTAEVWRYLLDIDWAVTVTARLLPADHPLWWLLANPRHMRLRIGDGLWVRLLDVGAALSARVYSADAAVVIDVVDAFCPWNACCWRLSDGAAKRTKASPQLRCDVTALGSAYLGAFSFSELVRGGRVDELRRGAAARADAMFRWDRAPWCPEIF
jgi:predicted acetyltransferase